MLPAPQRLNRSTDFERVVRRGSRAGKRRLVVHVAPRPADELVVSGEPTARAGLVVSKSVGGAVVRKAVSRRIRHQLPAVLAGLPPETDIVVRALPASASATSHELAGDLRGALAAALRRRS